jgi:outer membrane protein TolC
MSRLTILSVAIGCALCWQATPAFCKEAKPAAAPVLTLQQALELAMQNNRPLKTATLEVEKAENLTDAARTRRFPSLNVLGISGSRLSESKFEFNQGAFGTFPGIGPVPGANTEIKETARWSSFVQASAVQPLTPLLRINEGIRLSEVTEQVAQEQRREQRHAVVNQVKRVYFQAQQSQSALEATDEAIRLLQELDRVVQEQVTQRKALRADSLEVKTRLAEATHRAVTLESDLTSQKERLNELLGRDVRSEFTLEPVSSITPTRIDAETLLTQALARRPSLKAARLRVQQAEHDKQIKALQYVPDLSLIVAHAEGVNIGQVLPNQVSVAGVLLNWEVFDWGRKQRELAEKRRTVDQTQLGVLEAEAQVAVEVRHLLRNLEDAQSLLPVKQLAQEAAKEKVRLTMNRYTQKAALLQDVLQAQSALADANHQYQQAILGIMTSRADFEKAIGDE